MLVKGATPVEILKQYMAKGDSPTRGRELNIHFGDTERGFIGQISPLGDMVPVMAGVTLSFKMRGEDRVGLVYVGDGATSTGAFHEGINFAAVQRCPLVVSSRTTATRTRRRPSKQTAREAVRRQGDRLRHPGEQADGNDVLAIYDATKRAVDRARARRRRHARRADDVPPEGTRRARQPVVRAGGRDRALGGGERSDRPLRRAAAERRRARPSELAAIDARVVREIDEATDVAEASAMPEPLDALRRRSTPIRPRSSRSGSARASARSCDENERPEGWGTFDTPRGRD